MPWSDAACARIVPARTRSKPRSTPSTATRSWPPTPDWRQILALYDQLLTFTPTAIVALNRAVAVAEVDGPGAGLGLIDGLPLERYHVYHAIRADLLRRLGRLPEAAAAYRAALGLTDNAAEIAVLRRRLEALGAR